MTKNSWFLSKTAAQGPESPIKGTLIDYICGTEAPRCHSNSFLVIYYFFWTCRPHFWVSLMVLFKRSISMCSIYVCASDRISNAFNFIALNERQEKLIFFTTIDANHSLHKYNLIQYQDLREYDVLVHAVWSVRPTDFWSIPDLVNYKVHTTNSIILFYFIA